MTVVVIALLIVPAAAAVASLWLSGRAAGLVTAVSGIASFVLVLTLVPAAAHRDLAGPGFLRVDALSVVFLLATAFLYGCVAVYSIGYLGTAAHGGARDERYARRFWAGLNLFAWSMLAAPVMGNLALLWVAIEVTTIVSALLVALEGTDGAAEAAWKYVLLASAGLALALLGTIFLYYAGSRVLGPSYNLAFGPLLAVAGRLPHTAVRLAFVLAVLGFGTKVGLFPVQDRKSTRLNSSHGSISYAVFCLKKKMSSVIISSSVDSTPLDRSLLASSMARSMVIKATLNISLRTSIVPGIFFFFIVAATTEIYTLSLHVALPI